MTPFEVSAVTSTAVTDLMNGVLLLVTFLRLLRHLPSGRAESRYWTGFLLMASVSSILGWATHAYTWGFGMMFLLWLVLSATILETAHNFYMLALCTVSGGEPDHRLLLRCRFFESGALLFLIAAMLFRWHPIQPLVVLVVFLVVPGMYHFVRLALQGHRGARILLCFILPLIPCLVLQVMGLHEETVVGKLNVDGLCHLFIMLDIPIVYAAARKWDQHSAYLNQV